MLIRASSRGGLYVDGSLGQPWWVGFYSSCLCAVNASVSVLLSCESLGRLGLTCDNTWGCSNVEINSEKAFVSLEDGSIGALVAYCMFCNTSVSQEWQFNELLLALDKLSCWLSARCLCSKLKDCLCYKTGQA